MAQMPRWRSTNTPGPWGYVLAVLVSIVVFSAGLALWYAGDENYGPTTLAEFFWWTLLASGFVSVVAIPLALVVVPTVHHLCVDVDHQSVHVAAAAATTCLPVLAGVLLSRPDTSSIAAEATLVGLAGGAAGIGRATVVPLVRRGRTQDPRSASAEERHS